MPQHAGLRPIINFHGIGEAVRPYEPGEESYWITVRFFEQILSFVTDNNLQARVSITFDDANKSDLEIAAPRLEAAGLSAQFFILSGKLGAKGYLTANDVRTLHQSAMTIGSHGQNHVDWTRQQPEALDTEVMQAKRDLEQIISAPITAAGIPFGKYNRRVLQALKAADFERVYSSDGGWSDASRWFQPRTSIDRDMTMADVESLLLSDIALPRRLNRNLRILGKSLI